MAAWIGVSSLEPTWADGSGRGETAGTVRPPMLACLMPYGGANWKLAIREAFEQVGGRLP